MCFERTIRSPMVKRNETGSLVFIDWWPCMHWAHQSLSNRPLSRCLSLLCFFFLFHSANVDLSRIRRQEGRKKSSESKFFFLKIPLHIVRYVLLVGWAFRKRSMEYSYMGFWNDMYFEYCWFFWCSKLGCHSSMLLSFTRQWPQLPASSLAVFKLFPAELLKRSKIMASST